MSQRKISQVFQRLQNSVRHGQVTLGPDETGVVQKVQVSITPYETLTVPSAQFYGLASSMPVGTDVSLVNMEGTNSKPLIIASNHQSYRPKNMLIGEVQLYDNAGQSIYIKNGKIVAITATETVIINAPKGCTINASTGANGVTINGDLTVNGQITSTGDQIAKDVSQLNHVHSGVMRGGGDTDKPVQ